MKVFYIVQFIDGRYLGNQDDAVIEYRAKAIDAFRFKSEDDAIDAASRQKPFTVIKFYK